MFRNFQESENQAKKIGPQRAIALFPDDPDVLATSHIAGSTDVPMQGIVRVVAKLELKNNLWKQTRCKPSCIPDPSSF